MKTTTLLLHISITQVIIFAASLRAATNTIAPGEIRAGSITLPGQTNFYTFTASSNDVVSFALVRTNGTGGTDLYLYDPQGNQVASSLGDGLRVYYPELHLTESGTYIFAVLSSGLTGTYDYLLSLTKIAGGVN